jgi:ABC-type phosphate transport system substrate-binding protein
MYTIQRVVLFVSIIWLACGNVVLEGETFYDGLISQWSFAYSIASEVSIGYVSNTNASSLGKIALISDYELDNETSFACPVTVFPVDMIYNLNAVTYNTTLNVTESMLKRMINETSMKWNDAEIVQFNPSLAINGLQVRLVLDLNPTPVNTMIITWLYGKDKASSQNGSFVGLAAAKHFTVNGPSNVVSTVSVVSNTLGFAQLSIVKNQNSPNIRSAGLIRAPGPIYDNSTITNSSIYTAITKDSKNAITHTTIGKRLYANMEITNSTWPLVVFGYIDYSDIGTDCDNITTLARFFYWVFGNEFLYTVTTDTGFWLIDNETYTVMRNHISDINCDNSEVLVYENLSSENRSNAVFGVAVGFMSTFFVMLVIAWITHKSRRKIPIIANHGLVILGLACSMASFVIWWYSPSKTGYCIARGWLLGIGYINVVASIIAYTFTINVVYTNIKKMTTRLISTWHLFALYIILNAIEILILLLWTFIEEPRSYEEVVDTIQWQTIFTCKENYGIIYVIQLIYFCIVCAWGCWILYKFFMENCPEDPKPLLFSLAGQIFLLVLLITMLQIIDLDDNRLYVVTVLFFLFGEGAIIYSFFFPRFLKMGQPYLSSTQSGGKTNKMTPSQSTVDMSSNGFDLKDLAVDSSI